MVMSGGAHDRTLTGKRVDPQRIDFDREGWKVEVRADDGLMQITGRSPRNTKHLLLHIVEITGAGVPAQRHRAMFASTGASDSWKLVPASGALGRWSDTPVPLVLSTIGANRRDMTR
jgi:hypothetical protein